MREDPFASGFDDAQRSVTPFVSARTARLLGANAPGTAVAASNSVAVAGPLQLLDPRKWTKPAPARRWIIPDWIPRGVVTGLYGDGGVGKSLLAQQLLTCTAMTLPWLGLETVGGRTLGVFCEDSGDELQRRQQDINQALRLEPASLENLRLLSRLGEENTLFAFHGEQGELTPFFHALNATCASLRPQLLVLDTAADLFGGNENDRPKVRAFISACLGRLARDHDAAVLLCAHPSVEGMRSGHGTGGSTAWSNTLRSRLYLTRLKTERDDAPLDDRRVLTRMKANYAAAGARVEMTWSDGAFELTGPGLRTADPATWPAITAMFDELERAWADGKPWSYRAETRKGGRYFPAWATKHLGVPEQRTVKLLADWQMNRCLAFDTFDKHAKTKGLRVIRRPDR